jgi:hypothetical protein
MMSDARCHMFSWVRGIIEFPSWQIIGVDGFVEF